MNDDLTPGTISLMSAIGTRDQIEVVRISCDGIWMHPDVQADEVAQKFLEALDEQVKTLVQRAVEAEREACAQVCDDWPNGRDDVYLIGKAIRARGNT